LDVELLPSPIVTVVGEDLLHSNEWHHYIKTE